MTYIPNVLKERETGRLLAEMAGWTKPELDAMYKAAGHNTFDLDFMVIIADRLKERGKITAWEMYCNRFEARTVCVFSKDDEEVVIEKVQDGNYAAALVEALGKACGIKEE